MHVKSIGNSSIYTYIFSMNIMIVEPARSVQHDLTANIEVVGWRKATAILHLLQFYYII